MINHLNRLLNRSRDMLFIPVFEGYWSKRLQGKVTCLLYHRIGETDNDVLSKIGVPIITPAQFERDLRLLRDLGVRFLTFADLRHGYFPSDQEIGIVICFDDCFADNYTVGLNILEKMEINAVFFQITAMIDAREPIWEHCLYWYFGNTECRGTFEDLIHEVLGHREGITRKSGFNLLDTVRDSISTEEMEILFSEAQPRIGNPTTIREIIKTYPTRGEIKKAQERGNEIGSHGHNHYVRTNIDTHTFEKELQASTDVLTDIIGERPQAFSYPFGKHANDEHICAKYFSQVATTQRGQITRQTNPYRLPRCSWPGMPRNDLRQRRWLLTGGI